MMELDFEHLAEQLKFRTTDDYRKINNHIVEYFRSLPEARDAAKEFICEWRAQDESVIDFSSCFYVDESCVLYELPDEIKDPAAGFCSNEYIHMSGRLVFPVKDTNGDVMGFVGWDGEAKEFGKPKYLDSHNPGYKAKEATLYGMERLYEYYTNTDYIYIVEGLMCCNYLRSKGFCSMATLGSKLTKYVILILKRFGKRAVIIPDNDDAGLGFVKQVKRVLPEAIVCTPLLAKDIDDSRKVNEDLLLEELREVPMNRWGSYTTINVF